ncbi:hypothetical protein fh0823_00240 [Francisella halioticida]|uniref:YybH family protein n=1 Tax=Francisella halioticida TaxID=549298 RepID=UPI001AF55A40|nr:hypothetical protein fh0823_00240 [Francisella halioticida]
MKKVCLFMISLFTVLSAYATVDCSNKSFDAIKDQAIQMEKAWDSANGNKLVSFYDNDFVYMSGGKPYTSKAKVLKHYVDGFATSGSGKRDFGKLKLNYQYCINIDENHQLVILRFIWTSPAGKVATGYDLLVWQKNKDNKYKIIVDFPQS